MAAAQAIQDFVRRRPLVTAGIASAALLGVLVFTQRRRLAVIGSAVLDKSKETAFKLALPSRTRTYADAILQVSREEQVNPFLIAAFMERETASGTASALKPKGPSGTGDFTPRERSNEALAKGAYPYPPGTTVTDIQLKDGRPGKRFSPTTRGWGHGLMQIDYASFSSWLGANDWTNPLVNIRKGVQILKQKRAYIASKLTLPDDKLWAASVAAYNTGEGNVVNSLKAGRDVDATTAGKDYSSSVLALAARLSSAAGMA